MAKADQNPTECATIHLIRCVVASSGNGLFRQASHPIHQGELGSPCGTFGAYPQNQPGANSGWFFFQEVI